MKKLIFSIAFFAFLLILAFFFRVYLKEAMEPFVKSKLPEPKMASEFRKQETGNREQVERGDEETVLEKPPLQTTNYPLPTNLNIPFGSQAPFANWSLPYQEACEEATVIMVHHYFTGEPLNAKTMDAEILKLVEWQEKTFGYYKDTTAEEMARMLREYFGHAGVEVRYEFTLEDIKKEVAAGHPVILPAAGRLLPNPNFRQPGPVYHALVAKGFLENGKIITNDPGTRRGADFIYDPDALMNAIHDWNSEDILKGRKAIVVVES